MTSGITKKLIDFFKNRPKSETTKPQENNAPTKIEATGNKSRSMDEIIICTRIDSAIPFIRDLFEKKFGGPPPEIGNHFAAFYKTEEKKTRFIPIGYVHQMEYGDSFLTGGLVLDETIFRLIPREEREQIKKHGGVAEKLLRYSVEALKDRATAFWGYVGDTRARRVDHRVGYRDLDHPHLIVIWAKDLDEEEKQRRIKGIIDIGPF